MPLVAHSIQPVFPAWYIGGGTDDRGQMYSSAVVAAATLVSSSPGVLIATLLVVNLIVVGTFGGAWWLLRPIRPRFPAAEPTTISRLTSPPPVPVAITGVVAAGRDGPVTSPLSRESCAWYRLNSFRRRESLDTSVRYEKVSELISDGDVVISDGTGSATLSMADVEHYGQPAGRPAGDQASIPTDRPADARAGHEDGGSAQRGRAVGC